jgi:cation:H+ antiporter
MSLLEFTAQGLLPNAIIFTVAAGFVWAAGTRLTGYLDGIANQTGIGRAFIGMLFLGGVTSLPEVAAVSTAAWTGNAALATNNLLGSVAINVMLIAVADAVLGRDALTSVVASPATMLQGTLDIIVLALVAIAILTGDVAILGVGAWPVLLSLACIAGFWLSSRYSSGAPWQVTSPGGKQAEEGRAERRSDDEPRLSSLILKCVAAGVVILVAGYLLSRSAEAIAESTGVGSGFIGLVLVGFATSLPEVSSIAEAVRRRRYDMALGNIFGTNLLTVALLLLVDVLYSGGPVLNEAGRFEAVAALLGTVLTGIFLVGLLERQNKTFLRMGYDAVAGIATFAAGLVVLYFLQGQ